MTAPHVETFLEMMAAERGASARTLEAYNRDLGDASAFLKNRGRDISGATTDDLRAYLKKMQDTAMAPRTAARRLSCLRQFYKFLYAEGARKDDPTAALDSPRLGRPLPKYLSEEDVDRLLAAARDMGGVRAFVPRLFLSCCMRRACGFRNWCHCLWHRCATNQPSSCAAKARKNDWCRLGRRHARLCPAIWKFARRSCLKK